MSCRNLFFIIFMTVSTVAGVDASAFSDADTLIMEGATKFFAVSPKENPVTISIPTLHERLSKYDSRLFILDVRSEKDYNTKQIPTYDAVPMENISPKVLFQKTTLAKLPMGKDIVLVCYTDRLSNRILPLLNMLGYRALVLVGGFESWEEEGLPIIESLARGVVNLRKKIDF